MGKYTQGSEKKWWGPQENREGFTEFYSEVSFLDIFLYFILEGGWVFVSGRVREDRKLAEYKE